MWMGPICATPGVCQMRPLPLASPRIKCYTISVGYTREWIMYDPLVAAGKLILTSGTEKVAIPGPS